MYRHIDSIPCVRRVYYLWYEQRVYYLWYRIVDYNNLRIKLFMNGRNFDDLKRLLVMMQQT